MTAAEKKEFDELLASKNEVVKECHRLKAENDAVRRALYCHEMSPPWDQVVKSATQLLKDNLDLKESLLHSACAVERAENELHKAQMRIRELEKPCES